MTKGLYGLIDDGKYYSVISYSDSYPSSLGLSFFKNCLDSNLKIIFNKRNLNNTLLIKDSLFCEWCYFYDKKTKIFEIWKGLQIELDSNNIFGQTSNNGYYPCKRILRTKIDIISEKLFFLKTFEILEYCKILERDSKINILLK